MKDNILPEEAIELSKADDEQTEAVKTLDQYITEYVTEYVSSLETALTQASCKCVWTDLGGGRKLRGEVSLQCPVHTKEGLILGFLSWMYSNTEMMLMTTEHQNR